MHICGSNYITPLAQGPNITSSDRVLIVAPHPDDETIACGGVIRYCVKNNIPISVVVTNGGREQLCPIRYHETISATTILGLSKENIIFLDYPQALQYIFHDNWNIPWEEDGNSIKNVYAYQKKALYTGENLEKNFEEIITDLNPTIIIYPYSMMQIQIIGAQAHLLNIQLIILIILVKNIVILYILHHNGHFQDHIFLK
ncbi:MAG: PIG-L family deacetylase [Methanobacterium sp.]|nr:PIG-L family deacetylase [Methanobacterium sp.]